MIKDRFFNQNDIEWKIYEIHVNNIERYKIYFP